MANTNTIKLEFRIELSYEFGQTGMDTHEEFGTVIASIEMMSEDTRVGTHNLHEVRERFDERGHDFGDFERAQDRAVGKAASKLSSLLGKMIEGQS